MALFEAALEVNNLRLLHSSYLIVAAVERASATYSVGLEVVFFIIFFHIKVVFFFRV